MTTAFRRLLAPALAMLLLAGALGSLSACNTVRGAGEDVGSVGTDVSNGAAAVKKDLSHP